MAWTTAAALLLWTACSPAGTPAAAPSPVPAAATAEPAKVVAGTGDPSPAAVAEVAQVVAEELPALRRLFRDLPLQRFFVHVHGSREALPDVLAASLQPDSPGFALLGRHQIHLVWEEMRRTGASLRGVVVHELVHELLDQFVAPHGARMPRWFHEGLAQVLAGDTYLGAREEDLVLRATLGRLPAFGELRETFPSRVEDLRLAYAQSYSYVAWLQAQYGLDTLLTIARATDELTSFERALVGRTQRSTLQLEDAWRDHLQHGSGAVWRVVLNQCFSLALVAALPILVLALIRRLAADRRAAERLERAEAVDAAAAASAPPVDPPPDAFAPGVPDDARRVP
ncbi:MAG: hypothetical protein JNL08_17375 [Planctomycetes bacterium]|nr:hypothetical protein [Planctomycetota bacterium]